MSKNWLGTSVVLIVLLSADLGVAQPKTAGGTPQVSDKGASPPEEAPLPDKEVDSLDEEVVLSAMKTRTTVRETPAIVTVLTAERLREQGHRRLGDALATVPGFMPHRYAYGAILAPVARGMLFGTLALLDGMDMYDPVGFPLIMDTLPLETVQRAEVTSGPGGVLWGANSFVGVLNLVSKTGDDLDGIEATTSYGGGVNERHIFRASVNAGTKLFNDRLRLFIHASYETSQEVALTTPSRPLLGAETGVSLHQPDFVASANERSHRINVMGNALFGPWSLHWRISEQKLPTAISQNGVGNGAYPEDQLDCRDPLNKDACDARVDPDHLGRDQSYGAGARTAVLRFRDRYAKNTVGIDARVFGASYYIEQGPLLIVPPSSLAVGGVTTFQEYASNRAGASLDVDVQLPWQIQLIAGGEVVYDWMPEQRAGFRVTDEILAGFSFECPPPTAKSPCPTIVHYESNRLNSGVFVNLQKRVLPTLALSAGSRLQVFGGKRSLDPLLLFEGAAVWSITKKWNLKINYAEGFRPPSLLKTDNGADFSFDGNPSLKEERSRAIQTELNARLLVDTGPIRHLYLRADYAYTWVDNFIVVANGVFDNISKIGVHTVEGLARLAFRRGHSITLGYTFTDAGSDDQGKLRSIPAQWFTVQAAFNLWQRRLWLSTNAMVLGSFQDPNHYPYLDAGTMNFGQLDATHKPLAAQVFAADYSDRVLDRVGSTPLWNARLRLLLPKQHLELSASVYNILDARSFNPEGFMDLAAAFESVLAPWHGVSAMVTARFFI